MRFSVSKIALWCIAIVLTTISCTPKAEYRTLDGEALGTSFHIKAKMTSIDQRRLNAIVQQIDSEAKASMSIFEPDSRLSRINDNRTDSIDNHLRYNIMLADSISRLSGGYYDITVKPLVDVLGFGGNTPREGFNCDSILQFVGYDKISISGHRIIKQDPRIQIDLNSIAKGYTVDLIADRVEQMGIRDYIVEVGGELRFRGVNDKGEKWRVGIDSPFDGNYAPGEELQVVLRINNGAMATSGNYRRFYINDKGKKISHTINPKTGQSQESRLLSATVVDPSSCARADAMCTMFMAMGADRAIELAKANPHLRVYFILSNHNSQDSEYEIYASESLLSNIKK